MKNIIKFIFALHVSLAYLGMLTGFGMLLFTFSFFYLLVGGSELAFLAGCDLCRWGLTYLSFILGPSALALAGYFYTQTQRIKLFHN
jgi:hypothetical protein